MRRNDRFTAADAALALSGAKRSHVQTSDRLADIRQSNSSLISLAAYLRKARIALTGAGHVRECSCGESILSIVDV